MTTIPWWLQLWATWVANDAAEIRSVGFPDKTPGLAGGWARGSNYWEDMSDEQDSVLAAVVDSAIDALQPAPQAAILWVTGVQKVARPQRLEEAFLEALGLLEREVTRRGMVLA